MNPAPIAALAVQCAGCTAMKGQYGAIGRDNGGCFLAIPRVSGAPAGQAVYVRVNKWLTRPCEARESHASAPLAATRPQNQKSSALIPLVSRFPPTCLYNSTVNPLTWFPTTSNRKYSSALA